MPMTWELRDYDREFFAKNLESFLPDKIFDSHAHLYELRHWISPGGLAKGPAIVSFEEYQRQIEWLIPRRRTSALFFGVGFDDRLFADSNEFVSKEVAKDRDSRGLLVVSPRQDPDQVRAELKRLNFVGLKVYHSFSLRRPTWDSEVKDFLTEEHVRVAHEEGLLITLHMVKSRALADPVNQRQIREYCQKYPNIRMVLAHGARGFNPFHTIEGIPALKGLRNVWCDASGVTEAGGIEAIIETLGHDRLLWGSDYPISHMRGRCVAIGDEFVWLYEDTLNWDTVSSVGKIRPFFVGHESLRALKLAAQRLRLSDSQIEGIFYHNARRLLGI
jgi:glutamate-1-semialdehyde 2,1-aminomutase